MEPQPNTQTTPEDDYDPHQERQVENTITDWETMVHFLKGCIGTGILSMPIAFKYTGLVAGTVLTIIIGLLCSYGLQLLIKTEYALCKRGRIAYLSYPDAMKVAFEGGPTPFRCMAPVAPHVVNAFLVLYQLGLCTAYLVFVSMNVKSVVEHYTDLQTCWAIQVYMCIFFVGCLAISAVPNLKIFAPFSLVANLFILVSLGIILYYVCQQFPNPKDRSMIEPPLGWVQFVGICFFALESVGVVVSAEYEMKNPKHFGGVLGIFNVSIMIVTVLYWLVGFLGFVKYGDQVESTITLNLDDEQHTTAVCRILVSTAILVSFGLQLFPAVEVVWISYILPRCKDATTTKKWIYEYIVRLCGALIAFGCACASDKNLALVLNVLGVVCITMLGFTFPGLMHLCTYWPGTGWRYWLIFVKDVDIIVGGIFVMILGLYVNIDSAIKEKGGTPSKC